MNRISKHKEDVSKKHVCNDHLGKKRAFYIFHIYTGIQNCKLPKYFNMLFA